jgi:hypothetical protein
LTETAKRTLLLNTLCNEERKESFAQGKKARTTQVQSREKEDFGQRKKARTRQDKCNQRKKRDFWTGEESKNQTSSGARRGLFQQQKHSYFILELEIDQDRRDSLEEIEPKAELRRSLLKEGRKGPA